MNDDTNDQIGNDGPMQTPQVLPFFNLMNPCSPQVGPHEFLIVHDWSFDPTKNTAWLSLVSHFSKIPEA